MGGAYLGQAGDFLIDTLVRLYAAAVLLRFLLQAARADFRNPFAAAIMRITTPVLRPLRRLVPGWRGLDLAALVLMMGVMALGVLLQSWLHGFTPALSGLLVTALGQALDLTVTVYVFMLILLAVLSLVAGGYSPMGALLNRLADPLLAPLRPLLPPVAGLDFTPLVAIIGLQLLRILIVLPVLDLGRSML